MDPRLGCLQEPSDLDLHFLSKRLQNISADNECRRLGAIGALRVNNEFSV